MVQIVPRELVCLRGCLPDGGNYKWTPKIRGRPKECPNCKSRIWYQPKQEN